MASTTAWVIDAAYAICGFTLTDFNSLANGSCVVAASAVTNSTPLDLYADVSFVFTVGGTTLTTSYLTLYILPLNQDTTTYGDATATGATLPVSSYLASTCGIKSGITSGSTIVGTFRGVVLPSGDFKFVIANNLGVAFNATSAAGVKARYYGINLNA